MNAWSKMKSIWNFLLALVVVALVSAPALMAQQVNILTTGTGGVGGLMVGVGTPGAARLMQARVTLTNTNVLALHNTAVTVIAAPGAGFVTDVIDGMLIFNYVGAYTESSDNLRLWYTNRGTGPAASNTIETTGFLDATSDQIIAFSGTPDDTRPTANTPVTIMNTTGVAYGGGNASNQLYVDVTYMIRRTGL